MYKNLISLALILGVFVTTLFAQNEKKTAYGILIDNTGSMNSQIPRQQEIAKEIIKQLGNNAPISIFGFATEESTSIKTARFAVGIECSNDKDLMFKQIDGISKVAGQTALYDAIRSSAERLDNPTSAPCVKPADSILIVLTDGEDRNSGIKRDELFKALKNINIKTYMIGLLDDLLSDGGFTGVSPREKSKEFLESLAKATAGKIVFPKKKQTAEEIVKQLL